VCVCAYLPLGANFESVAVVVPTVCPSEVLIKVTPTAASGMIAFLGDPLQHCEIVRR